MADGILVIKFYYPSLPNENLIVFTSGYIFSCFTKGYLGVIYALLIFELGLTGETECILDLLISLLNWFGNYIIYDF